ncbi:hypothetical protein [Bacillus sp. SA1-12]|uniref:hypothetical protein n=1 Tax=Bacillus sp. SA1-12 TaxID=1455638 RepID=UPI000AEB7E6D|nr:hypothetical protein [Bacillus sp. SA1-12]
MNTNKTNDQLIRNRSANFIIVWSMIYGALHLYWTLGGGGYPFLNEDLELFAAIITYLPPQVGSSLFVILCVVGLLVGVVIRRPDRVIPKWFILTFLWGTVVALLFFVTDSSMIAAKAYAFLLIFQFNWLMLNQIICIIGAFLFGFAAIAYQRKMRNACQRCGRSENQKPKFLVRWGKWITYIAVVAPLPYAISR